MKNGISLARGWHGLRAPTAANGPPVRLVAVAVLVAVVVAVVPLAAGTGGLPAAGGSVGVIVQTRPAALAATAGLVQRLGGQLGRQLGIINGFSARLPADQLTRLQGSPGVSSVTRDEPVAMQAAAYAPTTDAGSLYTTTLQTGAQAYGRPVTPVRASTWR